MSKIFICEICSKPLGRVDMKDLSIPMQPGMFKSLDSSRGIPVPFQPFQDFSLFRCRQCKARPFKDFDKITCISDKGFYVRYDINKIGIEEKKRRENQAKIDKLFGKEVVEPQSAVSKFQDGIVNLFKKRREPKPNRKKFVCDKCGREYKHQSSLARHRGTCNA